jgi:Na+/H+ antiporter NhaC
MQHPYGLLCIVPPVVAIVLAIATRRPIVSLLIGIFCGALVTAGGNPLIAVADTCEVHLWPTLIDPGKMRVFAFTLLMAGMIGVICRCGGMQGLIFLISPLAKNRRSGQLTAWFMGLLVFFDDYANTILLGGTLSPLCDRLRISREKLAYLVDSTAAPVASLALLSTWIAVEVDYIGEGIDGVGIPNNLKPIELFVASIPYRFYAWMALLMVPLVAIMGRDFGPMLKSERDCIARPKIGPSPSNDEGGDDQQSLEHGTSVIPSRWYNAVAPIAMTLCVVVYLLYWTGMRSIDASPSGEPVSLRDILGAADSSLALQYGSLAGLLLAVVLCRIQRLLTPAEILQATGSGMRVVLPAIAILWCASALSRMTGNKSVEGASAAMYEFKQHRLYTGDYLAHLIMPPAEVGSDVAAGEDLMVVKLLPTAVFLLAAVLAFSTGTSFGTMGLLMPMSVTLVFGLLNQLEGGVDPAHPLLLACVASVLSGAVMGDHCSPISDTTILSSQACGCDHISHVVTQLPYAVTVGLVSVVLGTLPLGWGVSVWILLPLQLVALVAVLRIVGKRVAS